jgi:hypothetical protein
MSFLFDLPPQYGVVIYYVANKDVVHQEVLKVIAWPAEKNFGR